MFESSSPFHRAVSKPLELTYWRLSCHLRPASPRVIGLSTSITTTLFLPGDRGAPQLIGSPEMTPGGYNRAFLGVPDFGRSQTCSTPQLSLTQESPTAAAFQNVALSSIAQLHGDPTARSRGPPTHPASHPPSFPRDPILLAPTSFCGSLPGLSLLCPLPASPQD